MGINDFPTELLEEIFLMSTQSQDQSYSPLSICCRSSAISSVLSKTCKRWRDIALNFAPLWTHIHVVDPQQVSIVQDLKEWMRRAGKFLLCLSLRQHQSDDQEAIVAIVNLYLNSLHRCRSFELFTSIDPIHFSLRNVEKVPSPFLESVNVWYPEPKRVNTWDRILLANLLLHTPSLRTIRWCCQRLGPLLITWENLRELSICGLGNLGESLDALSHCKNLEHLKIHGRTPARPTTPSVALPRVTHFSLGYTFTSKSLLRSLVLPSLTDLEIDLSGRLLWDPILDMMQRSDAILRRLGITNTDTTTYQRLTQAELIRVLKMPYFHELRVLEIEERMMGGCDIIGFLTLPTSRNTIMSAEGGGDDDGTSGYLVHLERICLVFQGVRGRKILPGLRKLVKSRLGMLYDPKTVSKHIEISTQIGFSLSIPTA